MPKNYIHVRVRTYECGCMWVRVGPLELELQEDVSCLMWELGTELWPLKVQCMLLNAESSL